MNNLNIYDNYNIDINKYPRKDLKYNICDIVLITFFINIEKLKRICKCYNEAYTNFNECKDYYFFFEFFDDKDKIIMKKNYSAKEIISIMRQINYDIQIKNNIKKKYEKLDIILYFYLKNKEFFEKLFNDLENSNQFYFQGRNYSIKFNLPKDFYNYNYSNVYNALELFEIYKYSQFLLKNKIIKNLPLPKYLIN